MLQLFLIFLKIGATTFGGGYAMVPIMEKELVDNAKLINKEEFIDFLSVAQSFPGPVAVNMSLLIGRRVSGIVGGILSVIGTVLPSFFSIILIGFFYIQFRQSRIIQGFFEGVTAVVPALLAVSFLSVFKKIEKKRINYILIILSFFMVFVFNVNPLWAIIIGGVSGICIHLLRST